MEGAGPATASGLEPNAPAERLRGRRPLVVEDEDLIAAERAHALGPLGAVVIGPAATVDGARRLIAG